MALYHDMQQLIGDTPLVKLNHIDLPDGANLYLLAAASAIILGLLLGSSERLGNVATYISKFLGAIPPIVYIPFGLGVRHFPRDLLAGAGRHNERRDEC